MVSSVQVNVRTTPVILQELDGIVKKGYYRNRSEAVNEALRLLIRRYKMMTLEHKMKKIRKGTEKLGNVTEAVIESHEEEDL